MLTFASCSGDSYFDGEEIGGYSSEDGVIPEKVIETDGFYYALIENYAGDKPYSIAVGEKPEKLHAIYTSNKKSSAWFMDADGGIAAWTELAGDKGQKVLVYNKYNRKINTIYSTKSNNICQNIGVNNHFVYFAMEDSNKKEVYIACYDAKKNIIKRVAGTGIKSSKNGENSLNCLNVNYGNLVYSYSQKGENIIRSIDIDKNDNYEYKARTIKLKKKEVKYVYALAFDGLSQCIGLYYTEPGGTDALGYIDTDDDFLYFFDYFEDEVYAYHDQLTCSNGVLLYVEQINSSGNILDHYTLRGYEFKSGSRVINGSAVYAITVKDSILATRWKEGTNDCVIIRGRIKSRDNNI